MIAAKFNERISHLVLICDEYGVHAAFKVIKDHLGSGKLIFLSLVYTITIIDAESLYEKELSILEKRFSFSFSYYLLRLENGEFENLQKYIEAIINSNTNLKMKFIVFGNEEFINNVSDLLQFLNIERFSVQLKTAMSN